MADVTIPDADWIRLRGRKLFFTPQVYRAYAAAQITQNALQDVSRNWNNLKVSATVAREACTLVPLKYDRAVAAITAYNAVAKHKSQTPESLLTEVNIVASVFRLKHFDELFSSKAMQKFGVSEADLQLEAGLQDMTMQNHLNEGRLNAAVAHDIISSYKRLLQKIFVIIEPVSQSAPNKEDRPQAQILTNEEDDLESQVTPIDENDLDSQRVVDQDGDQVSQILPSEEQIDHKPNDINHVFRVGTPDIVRDFIEGESKSFVTSAYNLRSDEVTKSKNGDYLRDVDDLSRPLPKDWDIWR